MSLVLLLVQVLLVVSIACFVEVDVFLVKQVPILLLEGREEAELLGSLRLLARRLTLLLFFVLLLGDLVAKLLQLTHEEV